MSSAAMLAAGLASAAGRAPSRIGCSHLRVEGRGDVVIGVGPGWALGIGPKHAPLVAVVIGLALVVDIGPILVDDDRCKGIATPPTATLATMVQL